MRFVNTTGLEEAQAKLGELAKRGADLTPLLRELGDDEITRTLLRFEHGEAPDGSAWAGLKQSRKPRKGQKGRSDQVLVDTGQLRNSITKQILGSSVLMIGSNADYAAWHQFGTRHIPARPFLGVSDDLIQSAQELIHAFFLDL